MYQHKSLNMFHLNHKLLHFNVATRYKPSRYGSPNINMYRTVSIGSLVKSSPSKFSWLGCSISQVCTMILYQYLGTNCLLNDYRSTKNIWTPCGCDCVLHKLVHLILTLLCSQWLTGGVCVVRRGRIDLSYLCLIGYFHFLVYQ